MKRMLSAAAAILLTAALCLTSCGDEESSSEGSGAGLWGGSSVSESDSGASSSEAEGGDSTEAETSAADSEKESKADESKEEPLPISTPEEASSAAAEKPAPDESAGTEPAKFSGFAGKWEIEEMFSGGMTMKGSFQGVPIAIVFQFELNEDGTGRMMNNSGGDKTNIIDIVWEEKNGGCSIKPKDEPNEKELVLTPAGDKLTFSVTISGNLSQVTLARVDELTVYDPSKNNDTSKPEGTNLTSNFTKADYVGKWELEEMSSGGLTMNGDMFGFPIAVMFQFELKEDGTGVSIERNTEDETEYKFTWTVKNGLAELKMDSEDGGDDLTFVGLENGRISCSFTDEGEVITFKLVKVDKFTVYEGEAHMPDFLEED